MQKATCRQKFFLIRTLLQVRPQGGGEEVTGEVIKVIEVARGEIAEGCNHDAGNYGENTNPMFKYSGQKAGCADMRLPRV